MTLLTKLFRRKRYFIYSAVYTSFEGKDCFASSGCIGYGFPSINDIKALICSKEYRRNIVILSVTELSKKDYERYFAP